MQIDNFNAVRNLFEHFKNLVLTDFVTKRFNSYPHFFRFVYGRHEGFFGKAWHICNYIFENHADRAMKNTRLLFLKNTQRFINRPKIRPSKTFGYYVDTYVHMVTQFHTPVCIVSRWTNLTIYVVCIGIW